MLSSLLSVLKSPAKRLLFVLSTIAVCLTIFSVGFLQPTYIGDQLNQNHVSDSMLLNETNFNFYTYSGFPVTEVNSTHFLFDYPLKTDNGELSGSDAISLEKYYIPEVYFNAKFNVPTPKSQGFDEMVIFLSSNIENYKGVEYGIRMDLKDGYVYGYLQEPNISSNQVNFVMEKLFKNDGGCHTYSLKISQNSILFFVDDIFKTQISYASGTDYSLTQFHFCSVVHRFSDNWLSKDYSMLVGNIILKQ